MDLNSRVQMDQPQMAEFNRRWEHTEYARRLRKMNERHHAHPGVRWVLDLLPDSPRTAVTTIEAYLNAHAGFLPDGRLLGLFDAIAIVRARWMTPPDDGSAVTLLYRLSPREFEALIAALYERMGFQIKLTPARRDGGRDVIVTDNSPAQRRTLYVECKLHTNPIGVEIVRQLRGVVTRHDVDSGVVVTSSRFTRQAIVEATGDNRIELIDGRRFVTLLTEYFGPLWFAKLDSLTRANLAGDRVVRSDPAAAFDGPSRR